MELESHFEFISPDAIRIKGTRVGVELVIEDFLEGASPEEIMQRFRSLSLKQIYATITYYLFNKEKMDAYIEEGRKQAEVAYEEQRRNPPPGVKRLMEIQAQRQAFRETSP